MVTPIASKTVIYGSQYGTLPTPTRTGYTFLGWYTDPNGGIQVTAETILTTPGNHTLYAKYQQTRKLVTYHIYIEANLPDNPNSQAYGAVWCKIYVNGVPVVSVDGGELNYTGTFYVNEGDVITYEFGVFASGNVSFD